MGATEPVEPPPFGASAAPDDGAGLAPTKPTAGALFAVLLAGVATAASGAVAWVERERFTSFSGDERDTPGDIDIQFLWDTIPAGTGPKLVLLLVGLGAVTVVAALLNRRGLALAAGIVTVVVVVAFVLRLSAQFREFDDPGSALGSLQVGVYVALLAGVVAIVGSRFLPRRDASPASGAD